MRQLLCLILIAVVVGSLSGCGRKGQPEPPPGSDYPRPYPSR